MANAIRLPSELSQQQEKFDFLVDSLLPRTGLVVAWGRTSVGKTAWMLDLMFRTLVDESYFGRPAQRVPWLYCIAEGQSGLAQRVNAICEHLGVENISDLDPWIGFRTVRTDFSLPEVRAQVDAERQEKGLLPIGVYVFDTHSAHAPAGFDENSTAHTKEIIDGGRTMVTEQQCLIIYLHHSGWDEGRIRGASDLLGAVDTSIKISGTGKVARTLEIEKARDFATPDAFHFSLRPKYGGIVVEATSAADIELKPSQRLVLGALSEMSTHEAQRPKNWERQSGFGHAQFNVIRGELLKSGHVEKTNAGYVLTDLGREAISGASTGPIGLWSDPVQGSTDSPEVSRFHRNGHRTSGLATEKQHARGPTRVRPESGPNLEPVPFEQYEQDFARGAAA